MQGVAYRDPVRYGPSPTHGNNSLLAPGPASSFRNHSDLEPGATLRDYTIDFAAATQNDGFGASAAQMNHRPPPLPHGASISGSLNESVNNFAMRYNNSRNDNNFNFNATGMSWASGYTSLS